jgi:hypothetical protein
MVYISDPQTVLLITHGFLGLHYDNQPKINFSLLFYKDCVLCKSFRDPKLKLIFPSTLMCVVSILLLMCVKSYSQCRSNLSHACSFCYFVILSHNPCFTYISTLDLDTILCNLSKTISFHFVLKCLYITQFNLLIIINTFWHRRNIYIITKSKGGKSGALGGREIVPSRPIHLPR